MTAALAWLRAHACPPIRYRVARDLLGETPAPDLAAAVRAWPPARAVARRQAADGTWDGRLHAAAAAGHPCLCTEACLRYLLSLGWDAGDEAVARALASPHLLGRPLDDQVPAPDAPAWGAADIRAALLAEAGRANHPAVQAYAATVAAGLLATFHGWARGHPLWEERGRHQVLTHVAVWPSLYHLRLLAAASPEVQRLARPAATLAVLQPPPPGLRLEVGNRLYAPAPSAHTALFSPNPWLRLEALTLAARAGWVDGQPALQAGVEWFLAQTGGDGTLSLPGRYPHFTSTVPGALEPDWRRAQRRQADWTFRLELLRAALANPGR